MFRKAMTDGELSGEDVDPLNISSQVDALKDTRLAVCKIRGTIAQDGSLSPSSSWLPSRTSSKIRPYAVNRLIMNGGKMPVKLGHNDGEPITVDASGLDGGLNISMSKLGLRTVAGVLSHALDLPATSSKVFTTIWKDLESRGDLTLPTVIQAVQSWSCHDSVREALTSRLQVLMESGLFDEANPLTEERILHTIEGGGVLVVNLKNQSQIVRRILVEIFLGELTKILSSNWLKAAFLFAEEAHLYLRDTYWDDIVTRMRHIGLFTTFITHQPDTVQEAIYRQADNVFIFNFTNEHDIETIGKVAKADSDTIRYLVRGIPTRRCLLLGNVVKDLPLMVDVEQLDVRTMGETRLFFS